MSELPASNSDLDWVAFRYAAGELSGEELRTFEELLATDDRACLAVAQAVQLAAAIVQCEQSVATEVRRARPSVAVGESIEFQRGRGLLAACAVACSLAFVVWAAQVAPLVHRSPETRSAVAALWIDGADEDTESETLVAEQNQDELGEDEPVPEWLLAAVNEQRAGAVEKSIMQD